MDNKILKQETESPGLNELDFEGLRKPRGGVGSRETFEACVNRNVKTLINDGVNPATARKMARERCKSLKSVDIIDDVIIKQDALGAEAPHVGERPTTIVHALQRVVESFGKFDQGIGDDGCHYIFAGENTFANQGIKCENCIFFRQPSSCDIVRGIIQPGGICRWWIIPEGVINPEKPGPRISEKPEEAGDSLSPEEQNQVASQDISVEVEEDENDDLASVLRQGEKVAAGIKREKDKRNRDTY
jgi:hypothetical protein